MNDTNTSNISGEPRRPWLRRRRTIVGAVLAAGLLGVSGLALAQGGGMGGPWGHSWGGPIREGARLAFAQRFAKHALDGVGATSAQEDKIHDIIAATMADMGDTRAAREDMRKKAFELLRAPTIDRAAVEKLRADQVAAMDARSKKMVAAVLDAAGQLTPDQRGKLVAQAEARMAGGGGWRHRDRDGGNDGERRGGPGRDHRPDDNQPGAQTQPGR